MECHWGTTVGNMVKIMEKNYFAVLDYRLGLAVAGTLFMTVILIILAFGLMTGTVAGVAAGLSPFLLVLPAALLARRVGWAWPCSILTPFMVPVFLYSLINSTVVTLRQGGIRWRDTFYRLDVLRSGNVQ